MRRILVVASLLALSACGGAPTSEEQPGAETNPSAAPAQGEVGAESICSGSWACYCASFKTASTCNAATSYHCYWDSFRASCQPAYE